MDPVFLSRIQFAFLIAFHFLLPAFTIGLASYIAVLEGLYLKTRREAYLRISAFWIRIFAVSFGMGVVSGIVMPFQFGTNWSRYSELTAAVVAPLMGYEALTAFFEIVDGRFVPTSWIEVIFNPSFPFRLMHTVVAVYLTTAFTVIGVAAWFLRHGRHTEESRVMIVMGVLLASFLVPLQAVLGDLHRLNTPE